MGYATFLLRWLLLCLLCSQANANVEKIVFVAPEAMPVDKSVDNLLLTSLSEKSPTVRTFLNASFPTEGAKKGTETWMVLEGLIPGRRYEVRVNWIATVGLRRYR